MAISLSNKPNIKGVKKTTDDICYRVQLIAREGRVFSGLIQTRILGLIYGILLAVILIGIVAVFRALGG